MNEQNTNETQNESLYDAIERGFDREEGLETTSPEKEDLQQEQMEENVPDMEAEEADDGDDEDDKKSDSSEPMNTSPSPVQNDPSAAVNTLLKMVSDQNAQIAQLQQQLQQQGAVMKQQNSMAEQTADALTSQPAFELPALNWSELQYMDSDDAQKALSAWQTAFADKMTEQVLAKVQSDFAPVKQDYEEKRRIAANEAAKATLYGQSDFSDFKDNDAQIERIIQATPALNNIDPEQKYLLAGLIARGVNYQPNKAPTTEEIVKMATGNPEVMKALALQNAQTIQRKNEQIPEFTATSGLSTTNAMPERRVRTREDLEARLNSRLGL